MKQILILQGIPGSCKSSLIPYLEEQYGYSALVCSADHFHYFGKEHIPENYKFKIENQKLAHESCRNKFIEGINYNQSLIIVDNTNINEKDYILYYLKARKYNYNVSFHVIKGCTPEQSYKNNVHNVPMFVIENMYKNFTNKDIPDKIHDEQTDVIVYDFNDLIKGIRNGKTNKENT